jgi:hypothetical protein
MSTAAHDSLKSFYDYLSVQLQLGHDTLSPEQALAMWRNELETIEAVRQGIEDIDAGRTTLWEEYRERFLEKHSPDANE